MYTTNLIIAHNIQEKAQLHSRLDRVCSDQNCGIRYGAVEALRELYFVHPQADDLCFELFDRSDYDNSGVFLSINYLSKSMRDRNMLYLNGCFATLERVVDAALAFCSDIEIFITTNRASMEDFSTHTIKIEKLTDLLCRFFDYSLNTDGIDPEIHLFVRDNKNTGDNQGTVL
jgi:hypothetical protein